MTTQKTAGWMSPEFDAARKLLGACAARGYYVHQGVIVGVSVPEYWVRNKLVEVEPEILGEEAARARFGSDFVKGEWWAVQTATTVSGEEMTRCLAAYWSSVEK